MAEAEAPVVNGKYRSRKWILACTTLAIATLGAGALEHAAYTLAMAKILAGEEWRLVAVGIFYCWMFTALGILGGYGIPNVIEKWAPKGG